MIYLYILFGIFLLFNIIVRKSLSYKNYFTSKFNLLTEKYNSEKTYNMPKELLFEKTIAAIKAANFKVVDVNKDEFMILAISKTSFISWGENLYINLETKGNETVMKFCSTTFFQIYSWGKNKKNYEVLIANIESS